MFWLRFLSSAESENLRGSLAQPGAGVSIETAPTREADPALPCVRASWDSDGRTVGVLSPSICPACLL